MAWCGVVWCGVVWCGVVWCGVVWRGWAPLLIRCDVAMWWRDEDASYTFNTEHRNRNTPFSLPPSVDPEHHQANSDEVECQYWTLNYRSRPTLPNICTLFYFYFLFFISSPFTWLPSLERMSNRYERQRNQSTRILPKEKHSFIMSLLIILIPLRRKSTKWKTKSLKCCR